MSATTTSDGLMTLLAAGSTSSAIPTLTDGTLGANVPFLADEITVLVRSTAGSGTMTASIRIWGFCLLADKWYSLGLLNAGTALAETSADVLSHAETIAGLRRFSRLYAEIVTLGGTSTAVEVLAIPTRAVTASH